MALFYPYSAPGGGGASPAVLTPLADGVADTRSGQVGVSLLYAREDHVHPLVRIATPPVAPAAVLAGGGTITAQAGTVLGTTEETVTYRIEVTTSITGGTGWRSVTLATIPGYTALDCSVTAYRTSGTIGPVPLLNWAVNQAQYRKTTAGTHNIVFVFHATYRLN